MVNYINDYFHWKVMNLIYLNNLVIAKRLLNEFYLWYYSTPPPAFGKCTVTERKPVRAAMVPKFRQKIAKLQVNQENTL